jgi:diguanylate cyclase (GGDEF)-like protein
MNDALTLSTEEQPPVILIVDDVPTNVHILADALSRDYRIKVASNGREALAIAEKTQPDLILLDVMMPELDGYEVCRRLKANPLTQRIPVIFATARGEEADEEFGFRLGAVDYIAKPFKLTVVRARVSTHVRLKRQADRLEQLCHIDGLTGIPNRRKFDYQFESEWKRAVREGAPLSLVMLDIDHFKAFNDHYGHGSGDTCLQAVAHALARAAMRPGDLVARYGGEEFVALLPNADAEAALAIARRMRQYVADLAIPHAHSDAGPVVSVSIGCATAIDCAAIQPAALLEAADTELYRAKTSGRNQVCALAA